MALKRKISKEVYETFSDEFKAEYVEKDGGYVLDLEDDDTGALKRAKDRESQLRKEAEDELKKAHEKLVSLQSDDARKRGDIETLEKNWQKQMSDQKTDFETKLSAKDIFIKKSLVDNVALKIAKDIANKPTDVDVLLPHIERRLIADLEGAKPSTKILDVNGDVSDLTIEKLSQEFVENKIFGSNVRGSKASGSSAPTEIPNKSGAPSSGEIDLSQVSGDDLVAHLKSKE